MRLKLWRKYYLALRRLSYQSNPNLTQFNPNISQFNPNFVTLRASEILLISSSNSILKTAKHTGNFTCRFRGENDLYGDVVTDYTATSPIEVQDAIEDLNKIAFRDSVVRSRTMM